MSKKTTLIFLIFSQIAAFLALVPWFYLFAFSLLIFDNEQFKNTLTPYFVIATLIGFPIFLLYCTIRSWILFRKERYKSAFWLMVWMGIPSLFFIGWIAWIQ